MADNRGLCNQNSAQSPGKETVCIETNRVLDSCKDKDCFEDVRVILTDYGREIIDHTNSVRAKSACIIDTAISLEPVQFNRGFYQVYIRFYVKVIFEACMAPGRPQEFEGIAVVDKRVILFGGENNVCTFKSDPKNDGFCAPPRKNSCCSKNVPTGIIEVVDPIVLGTQVMEKCDRGCCSCCCACDIPENVCGSLSGNLCEDDDDRILTVSLGFFSVVKIVRSGQFLINAHEYCVPDKECIMSEDNDPCSIFKCMDFPTNEFCSTSPRPGGDKKCGC